ncbi:hypothetical protein [Amniculibacterium aquaticum]|uniref:hypothetical protein n=1 Tax=Amniculibacterium aquaticum TaxID=2479858 RepID=UPI000F5A8F73|nr:hypothetical protein [Amniculibacterium aquaticum]
MIKEVEYKNIDFTKYTHCINQSAQKKYSVSKEFLDITTGKKWNILVEGDYDAVMPLPFVKKFGLKLIVNPRLCQQLGVFSKKDDLKVNDEFLEYLDKNYWVWNYNFNEYNKFSKTLKSKRNYIIPKNDYDLVYQKYSPKRKRKIRQDEEIKQHSEIKNIENKTEALLFIQETAIGASDSNDTKLYVKLFSDFHDAGCLTFYGFYHHQKLINLIAIYENHDVAVLLGTFNQKEKLKISGSSVLIDSVIREKIGNKDFDFEGSEVASVEEFFRGFRPENHPYTNFENLSNHWAMKFYTRLKKII